MQRSQAWTLLQHGEPADEIRDAMEPGFAGLVDAALIEIRFQLAPPMVRDQLAAITVELGRYMAIGGGGWSVEQRKEWMGAVREELKEFPIGMLLESIARARRRVRFPSEFVPWIVADIEPAFDRLRQEEAQLQKLREIARS